MAQVARDGFARRVGRGDEEHLRPFAVFVGQPAQPLLRGGQPGRVVVQVHHVAVKADAVEEEETYEREQQDRRHQRAVPVGTHSREPLHPFQHGGPPPAFLLTDQVGKQHRLKSVVPTSVSDANSPKSRSSCESVKSSPAKAPMVVMLPMVSG